MARRSFASDLPDSEWVPIESFIPALAASRVHVQKPVATLVVIRCNNASDLPGLESSIVNLDRRY